MRNNFFKQIFSVNLEISLLIKSVCENDARVTKMEAYKFFKKLSINGFHVPYNNRAECKPLIHLFGYLNSTPALIRLLWYSIREVSLPAAIA